MLREFGYPATFFVYTRDINQHPRGGMAWEDLQRLIDEGFDVQNHSHTHTAFHVPYPGEPKSAFEARVHMEVVGSRAIFNKHLPDHKIWAFAYPMGYYSDYLIEKVTDEGYELALTVDANPVDLTEGFNGSFDRYTIQKYLVKDPEAMFRKQITFARQKWNPNVEPEVANHEKEIDQ
jgi:peptidoglycan/xylan/chitin deacetylase (PgdA/CDA1 family)